MEWLGKRMDTKHINHLTMGLVRKINIGLLAIGSLGFSSKMLHTTLKI